MEDEDDIGSLVEPKACFSSDQNSDISISPIPLAKTLGRFLCDGEDTNDTDADFKTEEVTPSIPDPGICGGQSADSGVVNDAAVLESLSYFSNLTSKVNDVMRQGEICVSENATDARPSAGVVVLADDKSLNEFCMTSTLNPDIPNRLSGNFVSQCPEKHEGAVGSAATPADDTPAPGSPVKLIHSYHSYDSVTPTSDRSSCSNFINKMSEFPLADNEPQEAHHSCEEPSQTPKTRVQRNISKAIKFVENNIKIMDTLIATQQGDKDAAVLKNLTSKTKEFSYKNLEKGDQVTPFINSLDNEKMLMNLSSAETGRARHTSSLSNVGKFYDSKDDSGSVGEIIKSPCKRQRSATCLIENETSRRKL